MQCSGEALTPEADGVGELLAVLALNEERVGADEVRRVDVVELRAIVRRLQGAKE